LAPLAKRRVRVRSIVRKMTMPMAAYPIHNQMVWYGLIGISFNILVAEKKAKKEMV
jgi:hypothetical protein